MAGLARNDIDDGAVELRSAMVASQLRTVGVEDPAVIAAMALVPREDFLPGADMWLAYRDAAVPLGGGRWQNPPMATGLLLNAARLRPGDRVLLVGAAGGYTAAVLARIVAAVVAVESDAALAAHARQALAGCSNVELVEGPLQAGAPGDGPFDVIVIDGAVDAPGAALAGQLAREGRFVGGIADRGVTRLATGAGGGDAIALVPFVDVDVVKLPGFTQPPAFSFRGM